MEIIHYFKVTGKTTILYKSKQNDKNTNFKYRNIWELLIQKTQYMSSLCAHVVLHCFTNLKISGGMGHLEARLFLVTE